MKRKQRHPDPKVILFNDHVPVRAAVNSAIFFAAVTFALLSGCATAHREPAENFSDQEITQQIVNLTSAVLLTAQTDQSLTQVLEKSMRFPTERFESRKAPLDQGTIRFADLDFKVERHIYEDVPPYHVFIPKHHRFFAQTYLELTTKRCVKLVDLKNNSSKILFIENRFTNAPDILGYWVQSESMQLNIAEIRTLKECLKSIGFEQVTSTLKE